MGSSPLRKDFRLILRSETHNVSIINVNGKEKITIQKIRINFIPISDLLSE
jgi:hypothetical protein